MSPSAAPRELCLPSVPVSALSHSSPPARLACESLGVQAGLTPVQLTCAGKGPESPQATSEAGFADGCVRVRACLTKAGLRLEAQSRCCVLLRPSCLRGGRLPHAVPFDEILSASARERGCGACCWMPKWVRAGSWSNCAALFTCTPAPQPFPGIKLKALNVFSPSCMAGNLKLGLQGPAVV